MRPQCARTRARARLRICARRRCAARAGAAAANPLTGGGGDACSSGRQRLCARRECSGRKDSSCVLNSGFWVCVRLRVCLGTVKGVFVCAEVGWG